MQCCGSVTFWYGGSRIRASDYELIIPDRSPAIFVIDLQDANKKLFFLRFSD
jgi:hypothetical protein